MINGLAEPAALELSRRRESEWVNKRRKTRAFATAAEKGACACGPQTCKTKSINMSDRIWWQCVQHVRSSWNPYRKDAKNLSFYPFTTIEIAPSNQAQALEPWSGLLRLLQLRLVLHRMCHILTHMTITNKYPSCLFPFLPSDS